MKLHKTTIEGAYGIKAGTGRDSITVDFDAEIPEDAKMIAIEGDNGSGKSTFMNLAMTPHIFPPHMDDTIYDHFDGDGKVDLFWSHDDVDYRSLILIKNNKKKSRKVTAILHMKNGGDWTPMRMTNGVESDGKARVYSACIEEILGPDSIFFLSAFQPQGARNLSNYDDAKDLMRDLLGLNETHALAKKCTVVRAAMDKKVDEVRSKAVEVKEARVRLYELSTEIDSKTDLCARLKVVRDDAEVNVALYKAEYEQAVLGDADAVRQKKERNELVRQQAAAERRAFGGKSKKKLAVQDGKRALSRLRTDSDTSIRNLVKRKNILVEKRDGWDNLLLRANEIRAAWELKDVRQRKVSGLRRELEKMQGQLDQFHTDMLSLTKIAATIVGVQKEGVTISAHLKDLKKRASYQDKVICRGEGEFAACVALKNCKEAEKLVPAVEIELMEKRKEYKNSAKLKAEIEAEVGKGQRIADQAETINNDIARIEHEMRTAKDVSAEYRSLQTAEENIKNADNEIQELQHQEHQAQKRLVEAVKETQAFAESQLVTINQEITEAESEVSLLKTKISAIEIPEDDSPAAKAAEVLKRAKEEADSATKEHGHCVADIAQLSAERTSAEKIVQNGAKIEARHNTLTKEVGEWIFLGEAILGSIDLAIEAAGPAIAAYANQLLHDSFGSRFTLRIVTQEQMATRDEKREVLKIYVYDAVTDLEVNALKKSGGESVWLGKALTDAVALYFQASSGISYGSQFGDEPDDGLTYERKRQFYAMTRASLDDGSFDRKYFISHDPSSWEMADARIDFDAFKTNQ